MHERTICMGKLPLILSLRVCAEPFPSTLLIYSVETLSSLFALFFSLLPLTPCSSSLWRDSPMWFKMVSVKLLATQEGTNRCPCSFFPLQITFCAFILLFFLPFFPTVTRLFLFPQLPLLVFWCHFLCYFCLSSHHGWFLFSFSLLQSFFWSSFFFHLNLISTKHYTITHHFYFAAFTVL